MNFDVALEYACDKFNFRPCRLDDIIENNGCPSNQIIIGDNYVFYDLFFFILSVIIAIMFFVLIPFMKPYEVVYINQRKARANWYWKTHVILCGVYVLFWTISYSLASEFNGIQKVFIILRGVFLNMAQVLLFIITIIDMQIIPQCCMRAWAWHLTASIITTIVGLLWFTQISKPTSSGLIMMGIAIPIGCSLFHLLGMIPVVIYRKTWKSLIFLILMTICNIGHQILDICVQGPLCEATSGFFTGASLSVIVFAFYRVFVQLYFQNFKDSEKLDGLTEKKRLDQENSSDFPYPIEKTDYSYTYTYTDTTDESTEGLSIETEDDDDDEENESNS